MKKDLYLISTITLQYPSDLDRSEHGLKPLRRGCIIKIGESIDTEVRVESLDGSFVFEKPIILKVWKKSPLSDKNVHRELEKRGFSKYRGDRDREFFEFDSIEQATREINDILYGTRKLKDYSPREEQLMFVNNICDLFKIQLSRRVRRKIIRALLNCKMRFGKCHVSYRIIKKMEFKRVLILTYKPNGVGESWEDDIDHVEFKDFTFKKALDLSEVKFEDNDKTQIIFASFQDAIGEVKDEQGNIIKESKDKWNTLFNQKIDLVIKDEEHYGYDTERSKSFLSKLDYTFELALSGTPFKSILDGKYSKEEIFTWTYLQEQLKRKEEKESGWKTDVYRSLPEFEVSLCKHNNDIIDDFLKFYTKDEKITNYKLFSNENLTYDFLTWIKIDPSMSELITNHMFWYLPRVINCNTIEKIMSNHPHWKDYKIVNASGNNVKDLSETKNKIYNKEAKTITLSCDRWNTGTTVKQWNSVWMLDDGYSAENWFQTGMRCGSPWVGSDGEFLKEKVHIVDFNSDRMLRCYTEYSTVIYKYTGYNNPVEFVTEMLKCMPIFSVNGASIVRVETEMIMSYFNEVLNDTLGSLSSIDQEKNDDDISEILKDVNGTISKEQHIELNKSSKGRGKNIKKTPIDKGNNEDKEVEIYEDNITKARLVTSRIKNFLFVVDGINNINDIFNHSDIFKMQVGIEVDKFKVLLDKGFIIEDRINDSIDLFNINNEYLYN